MQWNVKTQDAWRALNLSTAFLEIKCPARDTTKVTRLKRNGQTRPSSACLQRKKNRKVAHWNAKTHSV